MSHPLRSSQWIGAGVMICALLTLASLGLRAYLRSSTRKLPYHDSFAQDRADEWQAFGGTWDIVKGSMRNDSDERGAKLLTGSHYWRNYLIEADVMLLSSGGDAGLIIRSSGEEQGVDAYNGYYTGLRSLDNALVLGRAGHGWMEATVKFAAGHGQIKALQWYHLKLLAYGCQIVASAAISPDTQPTFAKVTDAHCIPSGRAGLRSYVSGGIWRNVVIRVATQKDILAMTGPAKTIGNNSEQVSPVEESGTLDFSAPAPRSDAYTFHSSSNTQSISSLRLVSLSTPTTATIRGSVILTAPTLFVQDSTGGVAIPQPISPSLKVGDQVEVTGQVHTTDFTSSLEHATVHALWEGTPIPAVTVSASQAATGAFNATFIEAEGRLRKKGYGPNNTLLFNFDSGPQSFSAIMSRGRGDYLFAKLKPNSLLRLRGVCVVDPAYTRNLTPFVLLLRAPEDVDVLAEPPWFSAGHLIALAFGIFILALVANYFYTRVEHWRLRAVLEERERLAHEMHDTLAQSFAGIGFQLEAIRSGVPEELPTTHQQLNLATDLVRHSHEEARRSIATLRPESLESVDLLAALEACARRMVEGGSVQILSSNNGDIRKVPLRITDTLYRIGQEAIANAVRHAHPVTIKISLHYAKNILTMLIIDDGTGFAQSGSLSGFGVRGMRKRAASISARFEIVSAPQKGTQVRVDAILPPRITFISWPQFLWKYLRTYQTYDTSGH
jgi:signal transduction histidine kinase